MVGHHRLLAVLLAVASALASPLTGGFVAMIAAAWFIASWPERRWDLVVFGAAGGVPVVAVELLFPGQGVMPFPTLNFFGMMLATTPVFLVALRRHRVIAAGAALYAASLVFVYAVPSAIGNNITRLGISFGLALVVSLASQVGRRGRALLAVAAVPFALAQWVPAVKPLLGLHNPSLRASLLPAAARVPGHARQAARAGRGRADRLPLGGRLRRRRLPARARLGAPARHGEQRDLLPARAR